MEPRNRFLLHVTAHNLVSIGTLLVLGIFLVIRAESMETGKTATPPISAEQAGIYFVPDVVNQFSKLALRPEALGFDLAGAPDPSQAKHFQGMARKPGTGTPYLFMARSGNCPGFASGCGLANDEPGNLMVVRLGSRETTGERLRSNRLKKDQKLDSTPPPTGNLLGLNDDEVVKTIYFGGEGDWPAYGHPGGVQIVGDTLAVPLETAYPNDCFNDQGEPDSCETGGETESELVPGYCIDEAGGLYPCKKNRNLIIFLDISNPSDPVLTSQYEVSISEKWSAGLLGLTPVLNEGGICCRYLMLVTGGPNDFLRIYRSLPTDQVADTTDLASGALDWELIDERDQDGIEACLDGEDWHTGVGDAHQTLNFIREESMQGALYLIGLRNSFALPGGGDYLDLYRFFEDALSDQNECLIRHERTFRVTTKPIMGAGDQANFGAAGAVYVSPSGELIVYSSEYENDGPNASVRFGEWRHREVVRSDSPTTRPGVSVETFLQIIEGSSANLTANGKAAITKAWITLFDDADTGTSDWGGDWLHVDFDDWDAENYDDFRKEDYSDAAGSWRWFAPVNCTLRVNDDDFQSDNFPGNETKVLTGTGLVEEEQDLREVNNDCGTGSDDCSQTDMNDAITSMEFFQDCHDYYGGIPEISWDTDQDGFPDAYGTTFEFDARMLDGPALTTLDVQASYPYSDSPSDIGEPVTITVQILNAPPSIENLAVTNELGAGLDGMNNKLIRGLSANLISIFSDPGAVDTHIASIDWGDSSGLTIHNPASSPVEANHVYQSSGFFTITLTVRDDDLDEVSSTVTIEVVEPIDSLNEIIDDVRRTIDENELDNDVLDQLNKALSELEGNREGEAGNGAIDKIGIKTAVPTLLKLLHAAEYIYRADPAYSIMNELFLSAKAISLEVIQEASSTIRSKNDRRKIANSESLLAEADILAREGEVSAAMQLLVDAVKAL